MAWVLLTAACSIGVIVVFTVAFVRSYRALRRLGPLGRSAVTLVLWIIPLEVPFVVGLEIGVVNILRDRRLVPAHVPSDVAGWVYILYGAQIMLAAICLGVLAVLSVPASDDWG